MTTTTRRGPRPGTKAGRRIADSIALEPGGPPSREARAANRAIRAVIKTVWACGPPGTAGMLFTRRVLALIPQTPLPRGVLIQRDDLGPYRGGANAGHLTGEWVRAGRPEESKVLLYLHGGGYFFGSPRMYRALTWRLSAATGRPVLAIDYRLAPEHSPADALQDALTAYDALLAQGYAASDIVVGGDSAGGHLTLALLLALRERGGRPPAAAVTISPWADVWCRAASHIRHRRTDVVIPAKRLAWAGRYYTAGKRQSDPLFAPARGDYSGLPPLLVISSDAEILCDDSREVARRAREAGVRIVHQEWRGMAHAFPMFAGFVPEGRAACRQIAGFLREATA